MTGLSRRQKLIGGALSLVSAAWALDSLIGGPGPSPATATPSPAASAELVVQLADPVDVTSAIESLGESQSGRVALPFDQVRRDLFVPTAWMEEALGTADQAPSALAEPHADAVPFDARHKLQGVLTGRVPLALIDGVLYRHGAEIDGYRLAELHREYAVFQRDGSRVILRVAIPGRSE